MTIWSEDNQKELLDFIEQNLETGPSGQAIVGIGYLASGHILPVQTWTGEKQNISKDSVIWLKDSS